MTRLKHFAVLFILVLGLITTGCPQSSINTVKANSSRVAKYSNVGINITRDLYQSKIITLGQKDKIADGFIALAKAGQAFDLAVSKLETEYGSNVTKGDIAKLISVFDAEIVARFSDLLVTLGQAGISPQLQGVIQTIKDAVLVIAGVIGNKAAVAAKIGA